MTWWWHSNRYPWLGPFSDGRMMAGPGICWFKSAAKELETILQGNKHTCRQGMALHVTNLTFLQPLPPMLFQHFKTKKVSLNSVNHKGFYKFCRSQRFILILWLSDDLVISKPFSKHPICLKALCHLRTSALTVSCPWGQNHLLPVE